MLTYKDSWQELLSCLNSLAIMDPVPENTAAYVRNVYPGAHCAAPEEITQDIITAITRNDKDSFYEKYCTPPMLALTVFSPESFRKDSLQFELSVIVSVRTVQNKKTLLISSSALDRWDFLNDSLRTFFAPHSPPASPYVEYRLQKLADDLRRKKRYGEEQMGEPAATDEGNPDTVRQPCPDKLEQLQKEVEALKQRFREITGKEP